MCTYKNLIKFIKESTKKYLNNGLKSCLTSKYTQIANK